LWNCRTSRAWPTSGMPPRRTSSIKPNSWAPTPASRDPDRLRIARPYTFRIHRGQAVLGWPAADFGRRLRNAPSSPVASLRIGLCDEAGRRYDMATGNPAGGRFVLNGRRNLTRLALLWWAGFNLRVTLLAVPPAIPLIH